MRSDLSARLLARREEIEQAILTRVYAVEDPRDTADVEYLEGLRVAVSAALDYAFLATEHDEERAPSLPPVVLSQARLAARCGVSLDTVLRRYFAGYSLFADFLIGEAERGGLFGGRRLKHVLRSYAILFDRLLAAVSDEYKQEAQRAPGSTEQRRAERVRRLLHGELVDHVELGYAFDAWHLAAIASGPGVAEALRNLATELDRNLLLVRPGKATIWAWFGGRDRLLVDKAHCCASSCWPAEACLALGEPGYGLEGWRLSHRQAGAALTVVRRAGPTLACYTDVALLAAALGDELLAGSLRNTYVVPLEAERDGGAALLETLRAYFSARRNISSTAASLGVSRQTVSIRLRAVEERIDRPLQGCAAELETALRLWDLDKGRRAGKPMALRVANG